ncbi:MAG: HEAT repeat domain-containing protein [Anaerolineales bacterium]|jgi:HEAT repeat protein|nr:HEAT repeat domain-containing protein [Anaerolineales bacterium]
MFQTFIDPLSFFIGFATASVFWFLASRARPLWNEMRANWKEQREAAQARKTSSVEENHRRNTLRRAQGMHLAAQLFALDEIIQEPLLLAPPQRVEPGSPPKFEDIITQTLPYLPVWPEIAAAYRSHTLTLSQALSGNANIVIIGQPGVGKTVALAHLASLAANRSETLGALNESVPFLVHVADLKLPINEPKNALDPLIEAASEFAPILDLSRIPDFVKNAFKSGHALLLVDGYDEIPQEEQRAIAEYFKALTHNYPKARIVTTGAPEYLDGLIPLGFAPLAMRTWSTRDNQKFIEQWGQLWSQTVALEAWNQTGPEQVDPLLLNSWLGSDNLNLSPLELTLKVWGTYAGDSLGSHVLETIATHIRRIAPIDTPLAALETLAMQVTLGSQPIFDPRKAREWVKSFEVAEDAPEAEPTETSAGEAKEEAKPKKSRKNERPAAAPTTGLLGKMASSGLLITYPNNKMRFVHSVFAGYLAGHALTSYNNSNYEETILNQPDWSGKYLAMRYIAAHGDASKLVQSLLEYSRLPMHRPLLAAARWLRDAPRDAPWRGKLFGTLAVVMQTEGIPLSLRGQAMAAFVYSQDPNAAKLFRQFAASLSFELAHLAILGAGAMQDTKAVKVIEDALGAPSQSVRRAACMALVAIGTNEALETVAHTLLNGDEEIRRAAGEALANDPLEGYAMLRDGITLDDILLRRAVMYGLGRVNETWAVELLQKMQVDDDQWIVRNAATEVLDAKLAGGSFAPNRLKPPHESPWLIEFAAKKGVGISPGTPATDILLLALKEEDVELRLAAMPYLKLTPKEGVIAQLYDAMYQDDPEVREAAYHTLWEIGLSGIKLPNPSQFGLS